MSSDDLHKKLAQGWSFADAAMGKGWELMYPHIANWKYGYRVSSRDDRWRVKLFVSASRSECPGLHGTEYTIFERFVSRTDFESEYAAVNATIEQWNATHGAEELIRLKAGWMAADNWQERYPHIYNWIRQSKRHCVSVAINLVTGESKVKAWLYDKPSNTETVLIERRMEYRTEPEILRILDAGIEVWIQRRDVIK